MAFRLKLFHLICCAHASIGWSISGAAGQPCTYRCDDCIEHSSIYYNADSVLRTCVRNEEETHRYFFGPLYCRWSKSEIHEDDSCQEIVADIFDSGANGFSLGYTTPFTISSEWTNRTGCKLKAQPPSWLRVDEAKTEICYCEVHWIGIIDSLLAGIFWGCLLATFSTRCYRAKVRDAFGSHIDKEQDFLPGANLKATDKIVKGGGRRRLTLLYRYTQIVANAWLPAVLFLIFHPWIELSLWGLLYLVPVVRRRGLSVFKETIYFVTPNAVSLFGIGYVHPESINAYLYEGIRPWLMVALHFLVGCILEYFGLGHWIFNVSDFFRASLLMEWGPLVLDAVIVICFVGVVLYSLMTIALYVEFQKNEQRSCVISYVEDEDVSFKIYELSKSLIELAVAAKDSPTEDLEAKKKMEDADVQVVSKVSITRSLCVTALELATYVYRVAVLLHDGRYILAGLVTASLADTFFVLYFNGHLHRGYSSIIRSYRTGLPTVDYMALLQIRGLTGVPCLMVSIYGMPLAGVRSWYNCLLVTATVFSATLTLAKYICNVVDSRMYNSAGEGNGDEIEDIDEYIADVSETDSTVDERSDTDAPTPAWKGFEACALLG